jgi:hypothetical protein
VRRLTGQGQPGRRLIAGGQAIGIGIVICLIAVGAILRFAFAAVSPLGLNLHALGVILILVGVLGLLLRPLAGVRPKPDRQRPRRLRPFRSKHLEEARREAAADVARIRDDGTIISPDAPAYQEDDL